MKRIFIKDVSNKKIKLDYNNINYLTKTLRIKNSSKIFVFDGQNEYNALFYPLLNTVEILSIAREKEILNLQLAIGEIKKERLEWLVEKASELGAKTIIILYTERSQKYPNNKERLNKIAIEACKQCNRITLPIIEYMDLKKFITEIDPKEWIVASLNQSGNKNKATGIIIGPEGGWTQNEEEMFKQYNLDFIKLGELVLRSETAGIIGLCCLSNATL